MLVLIIVVVLILLLFGGWSGFARGSNYTGPAFNPLYIIYVIVAIILVVFLLRYLGVAL